MWLGSCIRPSKKDHCVKYSHPDLLLSPCLPFLIWLKEEDNRHLHFLLCSLCSLDRAWCNEIWLWIYEEWERKFSCVNITSSIRICLHSPKCPILSKGLLTLCTFYTHLQTLCVFVNRGIRNLSWGIGILNSDNSRLLF